MGALERSVPSIVGGVVVALLIWIGSSLNTAQTEIARLSGKFDAFQSQVDDVRQRVDKLENRINDIVEDGRSRK